MSWQKVMAFFPFLCKEERAWETGGLLFYIMKDEEESL